MTSLFSMRVPFSYERGAVPNCIDTWRVKYSHPTTIIIGNKNINYVVSRPLRQAYQPTQNVTKCGAIFAVRVR